MHGWWFSKNFYATKTHPEMGGGGVNSNVAPTINHTDVLVLYVPQKRDYRYIIYTPQD